MQSLDIWSRTQWLDLPRALVAIITAYACEILPTHTFVREKSHFIVGYMDGNVYTTIPNHGIYHLYANNNDTGLFNDKYINLIQKIDEEWSLMTDTYATEVWNMQKGCFTGNYCTREVILLHGELYGIYDSHLWKACKSDEWFWKLVRPLQYLFVTGIRVMGDYLLIESKDDCLLYDVVHNELISEPIECFAMYKWNNVICIVQSNFVTYGHRSVSIPHTIQSVFAFGKCLFLQCLENNQYVYDLENLTWSHFKEQGEFRLMDTRMYRSNIDNFYVYE